MGCCGPSMEPAETDGMAQHCRIRPSAISKKALSKKAHEMTWETGILLGEGPGRRWGESPLGHFSWRCREHPTESHSPPLSWEEGKSSSQPAPFLPLIWEGITSDTASVLCMVTGFTRCSPSRELLILGLADPTQLCKQRG